MLKYVRSRKNGFKWAAATIIVAWVGLIALGYFARLNFGQEDDEFQHLHMAWRIGQGQVPYRDFFELHPPLWHFVIAPIVRNLHTTSQMPFVQLRLAHALVLPIILLIGYRILRRLMPPAPAAVGAGLFLISSAFGFAWFDVRPDWFALAYLLAAIAMLVPRSQVPISDRVTLYRFVVAGVLIGIACGLTQKAWFISLGFLAWLIAIGQFGRSRDERRQRMVRAVALIAAGATVGLLLLAYFGLRRGAGDLIEDTLLVHLGAPRERGFAGYFRASAAPGAGLIALGLIGMLTTLRRFRAECADAGVRGLLAMLGLFGTIAYLLTPAPFEQSYLFLICTWQSLLAAVLIWDVVRDPDVVRQAYDAPARKRVVIATLAALAVLALGQKTTHDRMVVGLSWVSALVVATFVLSSTWIRAASARATFALVALSAIGIVFVVHRNVNSIRFDDRAQRQARMYRAIESHLAPNEPIIAMWPPALPFRAHSGTFPFAHHTILQLFGPKVQSEYLAAIDRDEVNVVFGYMPEFAKWLPEFDRVIKQRFRPLSEPDMLPGESSATWVRKDTSVVLE